MTLFEAALIYATVCEKTTAWAPTIATVLPLTAAAAHAALDAARRRRAVRAEADRIWRHSLADVRRARRQRDTAVDPAGLERLRGLVTDAAEEAGDR